MLGHLCIGLFEFVYFHLFDYCYSHQREEDVYDKFAEHGILHSAKL